MTEQLNYNFDPTDLVRRHEAKRLCGITSSGILGQYGAELGHVVIGHTHFWSRTKCVAWRAVRPVGMLCTAEAATLLGVSISLLRGSYDRWLRPELVAWGHHPAVRSYDRERVLAMKAIRERVLASGRKTVPWSSFDELDGASYSDAYAEAARPSQNVPDSSAFAPTEILPTAGKAPKQMVRARNGKAERVAERTAKIKNDTVNRIDRRKST